MDIRKIIREELQKLMTEKKFDLGQTMKVDRLNSNPSGAGGSQKVPLRQRQIQQSIEDAPDIDGKAVGTLTGKEIMASTPSGYYYHGSHMPNLTKENVKLFSKESDFGNDKVGDRFGFYITSEVVRAFNYSSAWVHEAEELRTEGEAVVDKMREKSLKSQGEYIEDDIYGAPYSLIEDFARKQGFDDGDIHIFRDRGNRYWDFYSILTAVKRGYWPSMYKIKLRPEDMFMPILNVDISNDDVVKYTKEGVVGIYNGKLGGNEADKRDEVAILNRHAIASMEKLDDNTYFKVRDKYADKVEAEFGQLPKERDKEQKMWEFARDLLSKYK